jgi:hypothetical protein
VHKTHQVEFVISFFIRKKPVPLSCVVAFVCFAVLRAPRSLRLLDRWTRAGFGSARVLVIRIAQRVQTRIMEA